MGVTIHSPNFSIDMGYFGFERLRQKIADLTAKDIGEHYKALLGGAAGKENDVWIESYNRKTEELAEKYNGRYNKILNFLYAPDCDGKVSYGTCKDMLHVIGDYDDNILYGYAGRPDCAKFADFRKLLEDCVENKKPLRWR